MAQRVNVLLEDDLDGGAAVETVKFALDGRRYEIDLNAGNAAHLRADIATWVSYARPARRGSTHPAGAATSSTRRSRRDDLAAVRSWAQQHGYAVSDRGRISGHVMAAYRASTQPGQSHPDQERSAPTADTMTSQEQFA